MRLQASRLALRRHGKPSSFARGGLTDQGAAPTQYLPSARLTLGLDRDPGTERVGRDGGGSAWDTERAKLLPWVIPPMRSGPGQVARDRLLRRLEMHQISTGDQERRPPEDTPPVVHALVPRLDARDGSLNQEGHVPAVRLRRWRAGGRLLASNVRGRPQVRGVVACGRRVARLLFMVGGAPPCPWPGGGGAGGRQETGDSNQQRGLGHCRIPSAGTMVWWPLAPPRIASASRLLMPDSVADRRRAASARSRPRAMSSLHGGQRQRRCRRSPEPSPALGTRPCRGWPIGSAG